MNRITIKIKGGPNRFAKSQELCELVSDIELAKADRDACGYGTADWYEHDKVLQAARSLHEKCLRSLRTDE